MSNETPEYRERLLELASELLNDQGQEEVREHLDGDDFKLARIYLLGVLDKKVMESGMSEEEAKPKYELLGFDPEEVSKIRQRNTGTNSQ